MNRKFAAIVIVAVACLAAPASGSAARSAAVCAKFKQGKLSYTSETLGTSWSCPSAKRWIVKLIGDRVHVGSKNVPLTNGPHGLHCFATPFSRGGHATSGACIKGTLAFPKTGFAWNTA